MPVLVLVVATSLQVRGILQARDVDVLLVLIIGALLVTPYILVPIHLHRVHWVSANHDYQTYHPEREVVPEEVWSYIRETVTNLNGCGLKLLGHFRKSGHVPGAMTFVTLMRSTDRLTVAKVITILTKSKTPLAGHNSLAFFTESTDGSEIVTTNNSKPVYTPHPRKRIALSLPQIQNPRELYDFHQRSVQTFCDAPKPCMLNGNPSEYLKHYAEAELAHWVREGYYKLDPAAQDCRLTWKGAALIAWKYLWPIRTIRRAWQRHKTKKLLRKLEE